MLRFPARRRDGSSFERGRSLGLPAGLDGIAVAEGMFGTILSALKKFSLEDGPGSGLNGFGGGGGSRGRGGRGGASVLQGLERSFGAGGGGGSGKHLHLFSSAWSYSKWHSSGEPYPR